MPGWTDLRGLVKTEFEQSLQEGRSQAALDALRPAFEAAVTPDALRAVWREMLVIPIQKDFPFDEPSDLAGIRARRPAAAKRQWMVPSNNDWLRDRMHAAWLGRCAGCALGKPVENFMGTYRGISSKDRIKKYLTAIAPSEYPIRGYIPSHSSADVGTLSNTCSTREQIAFMENDDDICYTVIGQLVLQRHGKSFTTRHVAETWLNTLPYRFVCTAETQAYRNLVSCGEFHYGEKSEIDWTFIATHENPYREWIGAQIRADSWGYAAPGNPELAAEFAWRDARMSHVKNGIYGEMFCAAMIAAAFAINDPCAVIHAGLAEIPATSRLFADITKTLAICDKHQRDAARFEAVFNEIYAELGHYSPVHTNNNAALVTAALLLGQHDFEKVITLAVMGGWDTDCNGATAGSIFGAMHGMSALPARWIGPLNDTLLSGLVGYHPISLSECAQRSVEIAMAK